MKKILALLAVITASSINSTVNAAAPMPNKFVGKVVSLENTVSEDAIKTATFTVQHHDVAIRVVSPKKAGDNLVTGSHVTVYLSDRFELISTQSHWDGLSAKSRYTYTINYRLRGTANTHFTYSMDLAHFTSIFIGRGQSSPAVVEEIGVIPNDGIVAFEVVPFEKIVNGNNARQYLAGTHESPVSNYYHSTGRLSNGERYGRRGAMTYLLDKYGDEVSKGYHGITPSDTGYTANIGAGIYYLDKTGKEIPEPK
ncbi:MAG: hypothetical protein AAB610_00305 [Patescibacteria group bacterium]|mgnify:CR=1 FL=1